MPLRSHTLIDLERPLLCRAASSPTTHSGTRVASANKGKDGDSLRECGWVPLFPADSRGTGARAQDGFDAYRFGHDFREES